MKNQQVTPLLDALFTYKKNNMVSFHVPGHKNGQVFPSDKRDLFGDVLQIDATEVDGLDDLHDPEGVISEAEELLSGLYGSKKSYFLVNGSTVGNMAMIMGCCQEGDVVLVQRNCHKSVLNAIRLAKAIPVFVQPAINREWGIAEGLTLESAKEAIGEYPQAKAIILTYPSYYGVGEACIQEIISLAHSHGLLALVDEAHGAHFISGGPFLKSSLEYGADYVVHSAHKTLPAMTMGSYLHVGKHVGDYRKVESILRMLQSSSPSYPIMASLDAARYFTASLTEADLFLTESMVTQFRAKLHEIEGINVLQHKSLDILKVTIQTDRTYTGYQLQAELNRNGIYTELADPLNVLLVMPILKVGQAYNIGAAVQAIEQAVYRLKDKAEAIKSFLAPSHPERISRLEMPLDEVDKREAEYIDIKDAAGRISAATLVPYPPGIPYLLGGERITSKHIDYLEQAILHKAKIQGAAALHEGKLLVLK